MKHVLATWVLKMMIAAVPAAPWRETYESTATAIAEASNEDPVFGGDDGPARTAALDLGIAFFESSFDPKAAGDGACLERSSSDPTRCLRRGAPHSFCLGQINDSNFASLGVTKDLLLENVSACVRAMHAMVRRSFRACSSLPLEERLAQYAAGGAGCSPNAKGRGRFMKGLWFFRTFPLPEER